MFKVNSSPLSVGPIPSPIDPVQVDKAQDTFEKLYQKIEEKDENRNDKVEDIVERRCETMSEECETSTTTTTTTTSVVSKDTSDMKTHDTNATQDDIVPIRLPDKPDTEADTTNKDVPENPEETNLDSDKQIQDNRNVEFVRTEDTHKEKVSTSSPISVLNPVNIETKLPPLEDPSVILLSPNLRQKEVSEVDKKVDYIPLPSQHQQHHSDAEEEIETLAEEVKHIKEDKAVEFLKEELKDKIVDMIAYQKHNGVGVSENELKLGQQQGNSTTNHFLELRQKQRDAQREFHQKLLCELEKDNDYGGKVTTQNSAVAAALGTKFEVKVPTKPSPSSPCQQIPHSTSSHQLAPGPSYVQEQGSLSVPSKSPQHSRRGSCSDTSSSTQTTFGSHSLPRTRYYRFTNLYVTFCNVIFSGGGSPSTMSRMIMMTMLPLPLRIITPRSSPRPRCLSGHLPLPRLDTSH